MTTREKEKRVNEVAKRLVDYEPESLLNSYVPLIDISKPNFHDTKAAFQIELRAVQQTLGHLRGVITTLGRTGDKKDENKKAIIAGLQDALDTRARKEVDRLRPDSITDLIRKNMADSGFVLAYFWATADLVRVLEQRLEELKDQEKRFWSVRHRAPNYYPRTIALRLARLYARQTGTKPTYGTSRDGGHPSTDYSRALEEIFDILGIKSDFRRAAEWAVGEITENDVKREPAMGLLGGILAPSRPKSVSSSSKEPYADLVKAMIKRQEK